MQRDRFEIILPYQPPQIVEVRLWGQDLSTSRLALKDRFDRIFWLNGDKVGFDVTVYRATTQPPRIRLVIFGDYQEALFTAWDGGVKNVPIKRV